MSTKLVLESMVTYLVLKFASLFLLTVMFLYIFWKRLKEDYLASQIFTTSFYSLGAILLFLVFCYFAFPQFWFWGAQLGSLVGLFAGIIKNKLKYLETIEAYIVGLLPLFVGVCFFALVLTYNIPLLIYLVLLIVLLGLFVFLDLNYKRFSWYKSGRVGFSGLTIMGLFFLIRVVFALLTPGVLSFSPGEIYISASCALVVFLVLFKLAKEE